MRQLEVRGVKRAAQGGGRFHQVGHLGQQAGVVGDEAVNFISQPGNLLLDAAAALAFIQQDALFPQKVEILVRRAYGELLRGAEAQPAGGIAGVQPGVAEGQHLAAVQGQQPADGARKADVAAVPAHGFIKAQRLQQSRQGLAEHLGSRAAHLLDDRHHVAAAVHLAHLQIADADALAAGKTLGGRGGQSIGPVGAVGGRAFEDLLLIRLLRVKRIDKDHQAARRAHDTHLAVLQAQLVQQGGEALAQLLHGGIQVGGGQLFDADLQQDGHWPAGSHGGQACGGGPRLAAGLCGLIQPGVFQALALGHVGLGHAPGKLADAAEESGAFSHADGAACIQNVEGVRALEHIIVGGQHQVLIQAGGGLGLVQVVHGAQALHVCNLKVILAVLLLTLQVHIALRQGRAPLDLAEAVDVLQGDGDAIQAVGDFNRDRVREPARQPAGSR